MHRYILKGLALKWLLQDVGRALVISALVGMVAQNALQAVGFSHMERVLFAAGLAIFTTALIMLLSPHMRNVVQEYAKQKWFAVKL